jgi:tRNA A-37 threonylcarbamoyl transferase component Bud32
VVVKRYNIKNFWHGVNRALRLTRAAISWANAHRLLMYGIATAAPIALLEKRCGVIRRQAYFLAEYIEAPDAAEFFADASVSDAQKDALARHIAALFHKLYLLGIAHGDFKAGNMKIVTGKPVLIDLDSMREYRSDWQLDRRHVRDLRRFMRNWPHDSEVSGRLAAAFQASYKDTRLLDKAGIAIIQDGAT